MAQETYYALLIGLGLLAVFGNVITFLFTRAELHGQRNETRELTHLASNLQKRLNQLSIQINQSISRLERARDLVNNIQLEHQPASLKVAKQQFTFEDLMRLITVVRGSFTELIAIGDVIGDQELEQAIKTLFFESQALTEVESGEVAFDPLKWIEKWKEFEGTVIRVHGRIYTLLQETPQK